MTDVTVARRHLAMNAVSLVTFYFRSVGEGAPPTSCVNVICTAGGSSDTNKNNRLHILNLERAGQTGLLDPTARCRTC